MIVGAMIEGVLINSDLPVSKLLSNEERIFFKEQTGIDDEELKAHVLELQADTHDVSVVARYCSITFSK